MANAIATMETFLVDAGLGNMVGRYKEIVEHMVSEHAKDLRAGITPVPYITIPGCAWTQLQSELVSGG